MVIGKRLKLARVGVGLTQMERGRQNGIDGESASSRVGQHEKETRAPNFKLVCKFAVVLDVSVAYFYAVDGDLAELILQYHRYKKNNPAGTIQITLDAES